MIWAQDAQGGIGKNNRLLFDVPEDMQHFVKSTRNQIVVMGSKTWDSLPNNARPLKNRVNCVLSSSRKPEDFPGAEVYTSLEEIVNRYRDDERDIWIIGGGRIYNAYYELADELCITFVETEAIKPDTFAPQIGSDFKLVSIDGPHFSKKEGLFYSFRRYLRIS